MMQLNKLSLHISMVILVSHHDSKRHISFDMAVSSESQKPASIPFWLVVLLRRLENISYVFTKNFCSYVSKIVFLDSHLIEQCLLLFYDTVPLGRKCSQMLFHLAALSRSQKHAISNMTMKIASKDVDADFSCSSCH